MILKSLISRVVIVATGIQRRLNLWLCFLDHFTRHLEEGIKHRFRCWYSNNNLGFWSVIVQHKILIQSDHRVFFFV